MFVSQGRNCLQLEISNKMTERMTQKGNREGGVLIEEETKA